MTETPAYQSFHDIRRPRILLVDDEPNVLRGLKRFLSASQLYCEIHCASDGEEALKQLEQVRFDVVITDLQMPRLNGWSLLFRLIQDHPDTVRIVHSSHNGTTEGGLDRLAHRTLPKPASAPEILEVVQWAVRSRAGRPAENSRCA